MAGTVLYCRSTVTGCSGCQGDLVMCSCEDVCTKLYVLITELYGIAGAVNIFLNITFSYIII